MLQTFTEWDLCKCLSLTLYLLLEFGNKCRGTHLQLLNILFLVLSKKANVCLLFEVKQVLYHDSKSSLCLFANFFNAFSYSLTSLPAFFFLISSRVSGLNGLTANKQFKFSCNKKISSSKLPQSTELLI